MLRIALGLCNLSAENVEDGVAKLLTKADVTKIASKAHAAKAKECEEVLVKARGMVKALEMDDDSCLLPLGQFYVRVGLFVTGKGKAGREKKDLSLTDIKRFFLSALSANKGKEVKYPPWFSSDDGEIKNPVASSGPTEKKRKIDATLDDHSKPLWIAQKAGFDAGASVYD